MWPLAAHGSWSVEQCYPPDSSGRSSLLTHQQGSCMSGMSHASWLSTLWPASSNRLVLMTCWKTSESQAGDRYSSRPVLSTSSMNWSCKQNVPTALRTGSTKENRHFHLHQGLICFTQAGQAWHLLESPFSTTVSTKNATMTMSLQPFQTAPQPQAAESPVLWEKRSPSPAESIQLTVCCYTSEWHHRYTATHQSDTTGIPLHIRVTPQVYRYTSEWHHRYTATHQSDTTGIPLHIRVTPQVYRYTSEWHHRYPLHIRVTPQVYRYTSQWTPQVYCYTSQWYPSYIIRAKAQVYAVSEPKPRSLLYQSHTSDIGRLFSWLA